MELLEALINAIPSVGFPIIMSGALFWYMREQMKTHKEETDELKDVINSLNGSIIALKQMIEDKVK